MDFNISNKNILFICPPFYSLHDEIIRGLKSFGANVSYIPDNVRGFNPKFGINSFVRLKKIYYKIFNPNKLYLRKYKKLLNKKWDYLFCINGYTFDEYLVEYLKKQNPNIKCLLYLWDSVSFYDFSPSFKYFNEVFSFDPSDATKYNIKYLPLYWNSNNNTKTIEKKKYDVSFIGSFHTDRFEILENIKEQCILNNLNYYFKIVIRNKRISLLDNVRYLYYNRKKTPSALSFITEYKIKKGIIKTDLISFSPISGKNVQEIIDNSKCIIDIANYQQTGITNRAITSLASGKKVISTIQTPLVEGYIFNNISYLDRLNPKLDVNFIKSDYIQSSEYRSVIESLELKNWLKIIFQNI